MKIKILVSFLLSVLFLYIFYKTVGFKEAKKGFEALNPLYIGVGFLLYAVSSFLRAYRWHLMIKDINMKDFFLINNVHIFLNNILPARTGEFSFFYMLKKRGINLTKSFWIFALARLMDGLALLGFFFGFFLKVYVFIFVVVFGILSVMLLKHILRFLPNVFFLKSLKQNLSGHFESFVALKLYFISVISFLFKFLGFYTMAKNIIPMGFFDILPSYVVSELSSILPINGVMGLGTYEFGFSIPSKLTDISLKTSLDLGFITHVFLLLSSSILGILSLLFLKLEHYKEER